MRTRRKFNGRAEWLEARKDGIGASEVASIVGLNPWETPYQLWRRKTGQDPAKQETFAMKAGHYLEDAVARFWSDETGCEIIKSSGEDFMFINPDKPFLRVSPDRTYWLTGQTRNDDNKGILECKTTQKAIDADDLPKHWFVQVQMNLGVAELQEGSLAWLTSGREFGYRHISLAHDFFAWLCEETEKFWVDNVKGGNEPAAANVQDIVLKYARHTDGKVAEATEGIYSAYTDLKAVRKEMAALEERKAALEERIKLGIGDAEALSYGGQTIATWKAPKPSMRFDDKTFRSEHPDMYGRYTHAVQGARRFLVK